MSLYVKLWASFWTHRKTMFLKSIIGEDAYWIPPRLWSYASTNQPDGDFSKYSDGQIAEILNYRKDASSMLNALETSGFMKDRKINDWQEWNGYHSTYAKRAKTAATARWKKADSTGQDRTGDKQGLGHATSTKVWTPTQDQLSLNALFSRRPKTPWSAKEQKTLRELQGRPEWAGELAEIVAYYTAKGKTEDAKYLKRELETLLNNWTGQLDQARKWVAPSSKPYIKPMRSSEDFQ